MKLKYKLKWLWKRLNDGRIWEKKGIVPWIFLNTINKCSWSSIEKCSACAGRPCYCSGTPVVSPWGSGVLPARLTSGLAVGLLWVMKHEWKWFMFTLGQKHWVSTQCPEFPSFLCFDSQQIRLDASPSPRGPKERRQVAEPQPSLVWHAAWARDKLALLKPLKFYYWNIS